MVSNPADKPNTDAPWRTRASSVLTALAHGSAPFITTFLLIHLTAPAAANLGGSALSSQTMVRFLLPFFFQCILTVFGIRQTTTSCLGASTTKPCLESGTSYSGRCSYTPLARSSSVVSLHPFRARSPARSLSPDMPSHSAFCPCISSRTASPPRTRRRPSRPSARPSLTTSSSRQRSVAGLVEAPCCIPSLSSVLPCTLQMGSGSSGLHGPGT